MRFLGELIVIGAFTAAAAEKNARAKEKIADLNMITEFIAHVSREIGYFSTPLPDVMRSFGKFGGRTLPTRSLVIRKAPSANFPSAMMIRGSFVNFSLFSEKAIRTRRSECARLTASALARALRRRRVNIRGLQR